MAGNHRNVFLAWLGERNPQPRDAKIAVRQSRIDIVGSVREPRRKMLIGKNLNSFGKRMNVNGNRLNMIGIGLKMIGKFSKIKLRRINSGDLKNWRDNVCVQT